MRKFSIYYLVFIIINLLLVHCSIIKAQKPLINNDSIKQKYIKLKVLFDSAASKLDKGDSNAALNYAKKGVAQAEKEFGRNDTAYANSLSYLAWVYANTEKLTKAESLYIEASNIKKKIFGEKSIKYARSIDRLAILYNSMGKYEKAESLFIEELNIRGEISGERNLDYIQNLENLVNLYLNVENYNKVESLLIKALNIRKEIFGENNITYAKRLKWLAKFYSDIKGNYIKAEPLLLTALNTIKNLKGENDLDYAACLNSLAGLYDDMGEFEKAEPLFVKALDIMKEIIGEKNSDYISAINDLAEFYKEMWNFPKAETLYTKALNINKEANGEKNNEYAGSLIGLGVLYEEMRNYEKSLPLYFEALKINKELYGEKDVRYIENLSNIAVIYADMSDYKKAEPIFIEVSKKIKELYGDKSPDYATTVYNLSELYLRMGNYAKAEPFSLEALQIRKELLGDKHPDYTNNICNLAELYYGMKNYPKAENIYKELSFKLFSDINNKFDYLSEKEQYLYLNKMNIYFSSFNCFAIKDYQYNSSISELVYNNELALKGTLLNEGIKLKQIIENSNDTCLSNLFSKLFSIRQELNNLYTLPVDKRYADVNDFEEKANQLEKMIVRKSSQYRDAKTNMQLQWTDVQKNLKNDEAAIEFITYNYYTKGNIKDSVHYDALVLRSDYKHPKLIELFEEKQLQEILKNPSGFSETSFINTLYSNSNQLYKLIWKPIESSLKGVKTVYLSPSGLLNKISFAAITIPIGTHHGMSLLSEKYNLKTLTSTRQIALNKKPEKITNEYNLLAYGGIKYDVDSTRITELASIYKNKNSARSLNIPDDSTRGVKWQYLPGTLTEAQTIKTLFDNNKISTRILTSDQATEESFKAMGTTQSPSIIHIATHGFFFPDPKTTNNEQRITNVFRVSDNPLLRSGLLLAGANRVWKGLPPIQGVEDGILTAYEVSNINLSNTKLVTMSACETGLGDIKGSEGVFGLQRAFKMAGVEYLIMSLWQVPDKETSEFMQSFYSKWLSGTDIETAFTFTQRQMQKKYPEPYKWAAFVLLD